MKKKIAPRLQSFLPEEMRRARRQVEAAVRTNSDHAVHEARKSIKKLRAALRLARKMAPGSALKPVADALRLAAHALGPLRDYLVLMETGRALKKRGEPAPPKPALPNAAPLLGRAQAQMRRAAGGLLRLLEEEFDFEGLRPGLRRINRRARSAMVEARQSCSDGDLHAWRRRAKDLLYVLDIIEAPRGKVKKLKRLAKLLGADHDFATFIAHHNSIAGGETHDDILTRARERRVPLQKKAFRLGKKIFKEPPRKFARRVPA